MDFSRAEHDRIDLRAIDADTGTDVDGAFRFVGDGAFSGTAGELRAAIAGGNTIVEGDVDGDGTADFQLVLLGSVDLKAVDFLL